MATILISFVLVVVVVAAFMRAPLTGKLGLAAGIMLAVFSVFQLIAFACMAALASKCERYVGDEDTVVIHVCRRHVFVCVRDLFDSSGCMSGLVRR